MTRIKNIYRYSNDMAILVFENVGWIGIPVITAMLKREHGNRFKLYDRATGKDNGIIYEPKSGAIGDAINLVICDLCE